VTPFLLQHPPVRSQFRRPRRARPTGLLVVHTAENVMDTVGPDTGAENVAGFIRRRTDAGSYHDLVDSDSAIQLVPYDAEAYQDGTGSNPYALSLSFALKAADWPRLKPGKRDAFLTQGARALARQQAWLLAHRHPLTPLRRISRAQSAAGLPGFISHAERDPRRRKDPGAQFPWDRFFAITADLAAPTPTTSEEDTMTQYRAIRRVEDGAIALTAPGYFRHLSGEELEAVMAAGLAQAPSDEVNAREFDVVRAVALGSDR
jgi:hypothetical protein